MPQNLQQLLALARYANQLAPSGVQPIGGDVMSAANILSGLQRGGVGGYGGAAINAGRLYNNLSGSGPSPLLGGLGSALGLYNNLQQGGVAGDLGAAVNAGQLYGQIGGMMGAPGAGVVGAVAGEAALPIGMALAMHGLFEKESQVNPYEMTQANQNNAQGILADANNPANSQYRNQLLTEAQSFNDLARGYQTGQINPYNQSYVAGYGNPGGIQMGGAAHQLIQQNARGGHMKSKDRLKEIYGGSYEDRLPHFADGGGYEMYAQYDAQPSTPPPTDSPPPSPDTQWAPPSTIGNYGPPPSAGGMGTGNNFGGMSQYGAPSDPAGLGSSSVNGPGGALGLPSIGGNPWGYSSQGGSGVTPGFLNNIPGLSSIPGLGSLLGNTNNAQQLGLIGALAGLLGNSNVPAPNWNPSPPQMFPGQSGPGTGVQPGPNQWGNFSTAPRGLNPNNQNIDFAHYGQGPAQNFFSPPPPQPQQSPLQQAQPPMGMQPPPPGMMQQPQQGLNLNMQPLGSTGIANMNPAMQQQSPLQTMVANLQQQNNAAQQAMPQQQAALMGASTPPPPMMQAQPMPNLGGGGFQPDMTGFIRPGMGGSIAMRAGGGEVNNGQVFQTQMNPHARGPGDGTSDDINAKLSDGEYVMDAATVSMLGNGSNDAGARKLDELRTRLRKHAGQKLVKGQQFMKAKQPTSYMKKGGEK